MHAAEFLPKGHRVFETYQVILRRFKLELRWFETSNKLNNDPGTCACNKLLLSHTLWLPITSTLGSTLVSDCCYPALGLIFLKQSQNPRFPPFNFVSVTAW